MYDCVCVVCACVRARALSNVFIRRELAVEHEEHGGFEDGEYEYIVEEADHVAESDNHVPTIYHGEAVTDRKSMDYYCHISQCGHNSQ